MKLLQDARMGGQPGIVSSGEEAARGIGVGVGKGILPFLDLSMAVGEGKGTGVVVIYGGKIAPAAAVRHATKETVGERGRVLVHVNKDVGTADPSEVSCFPENFVKVIHFVRPGISLITGRSGKAIGRARAHTRLFDLHVEGLVWRTMIHAWIF